MYLDLQPPSASVRALKALLSRRDAIAGDLRRERDRQGKNESTAPPEAVRNSIEQSIAFLETELKRLPQMIDDHVDNAPALCGKKDLLETIPGVGTRVSDRMTALWQDAHASARNSWQPT